MPDFESINYEKKTEKFSSEKQQTNSQIRDEQKLSSLNSFGLEVKTNLNLVNLTKEFNSLKMNSSNLESMFSPGFLDFNSTTIEIDSNLELQKDNHLIEFNKLEDIFNFCNPRNTIQIKLKKGLRGLGISLCGGKQQSTTNDLSIGNDNFSLINQLIRVKKLFPAHPASECGLIDENDFILDVNDHCFVGLTYIDAFNILHSVHDEVTLKILKFNQCPLELQKILLPKEENNFLSDISSSFRITNDVFESTRLNDSDDLNQSTHKRIRNVILVKKDGSLGFTLTKIENEGSFYVKQITKAPASLEKDLRPGDRILSVNGTSLDGLDLKNAINLLRSLPDLCEFKLEQSIDSSSNDDQTTDAIDSLNYQSENEDDENKFRNKQLRHEVKIMLDSRNKDPLHNRLKRKELKKSKDESTKEQKSNRNYEENESINLDDSRLNDQNKRERKDAQSTKPNESNLESKLNDSKLNNNKFDKENYDIFMKFKNYNQLANDSPFFRQSSVIDFNRNESRDQSNENSLSKQNNNLNKWRNQVMNLNDDKDYNDSFDSKLNSISNSISTSTHSSILKRSQLKNLNDHEQDSGFGESNQLINQTNFSSKLTSTNDKNFKLNNNKLNERVEYSKHDGSKDRKSNNNELILKQQDMIQLNDIQLNINLNCLLNENSMYRDIENALFFYVVLDRIGWHGRIGFSLTDDDQYKDYRIVDTNKHGFSACIIKEVYPNSLAYSNGNIKIGDKLLECNNQSMINKPVQTVIKELRKLKGKLKLLLVRKVY